jgi:hypothetical protein
MRSGDALLRVTTANHKTCKEVIMADTLHDDSTLIRQPKSLFDRAETYQRENGSAMFWEVFIERDGRAEPAGTAYELSSGEIILPAIPTGGRVLLKHDFRRR